MDFTVSADHRINITESEKRDKYLDLARHLRKLWNMNVTVILIIIGALGTIPEGLVRRLEALEIGGQIETIQTTALLRSAKILRRVMETWGDLLSLGLQWKTISWCEKLARNIIIIIIIIIIMIIIMSYLLIPVTFLPPVPIIHRN